MKKKTIVQVFLFLILILVSFSIFGYYYKKSIDKIKISKNETPKDNKNKSFDTNQNLIENIKYTANNNAGDIYEILADFSEPSIENPKLMFLTGVKSNIIFKNTKKENIYLTSDFANFNSKTFETLFVNNVKILRKNEIITGNELYLVLDKEDNETENNASKEQNLIRMSHNVLYQKPGYMLKADILEVDLITKNSKIYMYNSAKKVNVISDLN